MRIQASFVFELAGLAVNFIALLCSHVGAFHTEKNLKMVALRHLSEMPLGYFEENPGGKLRKIIDENSARFNITNEGGVGGKISFLKNIIGLWLIQESRRQWMREGKEFSFGELEKLAAKEEPFRSLIDPDAPEFAPSGNVPRRIREFCKRTGQPVPETEGQIVRCINESLALKYRMAFEEIRECTGKEYPVIHMVGGGTQSALLCQLTANACGRPVYAGPVEATVYGNVAIQLMAEGAVGSLEEIRSVIKASEEIRRFDPQDGERWEEAYRNYCEAIRKW